MLPGQARLRATGPPVRCVARGDGQLPGQLLLPGQARLRVTGPPVRCVARGDGQLMWPEEGLYALRE